MLEQIAATSNGLVPLEEQAMVYAAVERGSAMADETAAVSEEQSANVSTMVQMMDQFKI